jgi:perosamine synthetase
VEIRQKNAASLSRGLSGLPGIVIPTQLPDRQHVWHQFTLRLTDEFPMTRDEFVAGLADAGVGSGIYYPKLVFDYDAYRNHPQVIVSDVPVASSVATQAVSIPVHTALSAADVNKIISAVTALAKG